MWYTFMCRISAYGIVFLFDVHSSSSYKSFIKMRLIFLNSNTTQNARWTELILRSFSKGNDSLTCWCFCINIHNFILYLIWNKTIVRLFKRRQTFVIAYKQFSRCFAFYWALSRIQRFVNRKILSLSSTSIKLHWFSD